MPELPEVETIKNDLKEKIACKKIVGVEILQKKSLKNNPREFTGILKNGLIKNIERKGKFLIFTLSDGKNYLIAHLRMTGQLIFWDKTGAKKSDPRNKHTCIILHFKDDSGLYFNDIRRFGYMKIVSENQKENILEKLGIDPLSSAFTFENFKNILKGKKRTLKSVLLDQKMIAGIGNIYADEICFDVKIRPDRKIDALGEEEIKKLYASVKKILKKAVEKRGTTFRNYVDSGGKKGGFSKLLKIYQKEGRKCFGCEEIIRKKITAGRSTRYCPSCQK